MDLPREIDDYIKESIEYSVGLPVSRSTLEVKLRASEEAQRRLRDQCLLLHSKIKEKDQAIERTRAEATLNALAVKKFVEENEKLASECAHLVNQCNKWERECAMYDKDREVLMDFGNEADQRAKEAELRVQELEDEMRALSDELQYYKRQYEACMVDSSLQAVTTQESLLESVLANLISGDDAVSARAFLEANNTHEPCQRLLEMWDFLKPSTQKVLALAADLKVLEKDKEHLKTNLHRAEDEVNVLFEENNMLDEENKKLLMKYNKEKNRNGSSGKHASSAPPKSNKRKASSKTSSPIEKKIDFTDVEMARHPLSPLRCNSTDSRMQKK